MNNYRVAILVFGEPGSGRNALAEEKYSGLARCFTENGFAVDSVLYHNDVAEKLALDLLSYHPILVWVTQLRRMANPAKNPMCCWRNYRGFLFPLTRMQS